MPSKSTCAPSAKCLLGSGLRGINEVRFSGLEYGAGRRQARDRSKIRNRYGPGCRDRPDRYSWPGKIHAIRGIWIVTCSSTSKMSWWTSPSGSASVSRYHWAVPPRSQIFRRQSVAARHRRLPGTETLGEGEAEAILLAKEVGADILLTDDRKARAAAVSLRRRVLIGHRQTVL